MANTTVPTLAINGSFSTAEPVDDGAGTGTTYLLWSDVLSAAEDLETTISDVGATDAQVSEDEDSPLFGEEIAEAVEGTDIIIGGFGRDVTVDSTPLLCPQAEALYDSLVYGEFSDAVMVTLYEDLCTAKLEETNIALLGAQTFADPEAECGPASARAFAHYAAGAIAGFINNLEFEIELHAGDSASAVDSGSFTTTVTTGGTATAQSGSGSGVATTNIVAAIEESTFTVTVKTNS